MQHQRHELIETMFHELCDEPEHLWAHKLRQAGVDSSVEQEVLDLLRTQSETSPLLEQPFLETFKRLAAHGVTTVDGFEIIRQIGSGGMGLVYLAEDTELGRTVAIKVLPVVLTGTKTGVQRFRREAQAVSRLDHPNIVPVYRFGRWDNTYYIASAYIEGETLAGALLQHHGGAEPNVRWVRSALENIRSIALALDYAHREGVVHRDIKPSNILLDAEGSAHLCDFGIAKTEQSVELTMTNETLGTEGYMSPEQSGAIKSPTDARSDVYSLGAVLYECVTGKRYQSPGTHPAVHAVDHEPELIRFGRGVVARGADLASICQKALEWEPTRRYQSAGELAMDLDRYLRGQPIKARRVSLARLAAWKARRHAITTAIAATLLVIVTGFVITRTLTAPPTTALITVAPLDKDALVAHQQYDPQSQMYLPETTLQPGAHEFRLPPGRHRITVTTPGGIGEYTRDVRAGIPVRIEQSKTRDSSPTAGMILIPTGPAIVGTEGEAEGPFAQHEIELGAFWIDAHEVTNSAYREYVLDTGVPPAPLWEEPYETSIDDLPVVGVTVEEAQAFAEWRGARLPTAWEWERASRGAEGRLYPWGNTFESDSKPANVGISGMEAWETNMNELGLRAAAMGNLLSAATEIGVDRTPEGGLHFYGNAAELTDSPTVGINESGVIEATNQIIAKGRHWNGEPDGFFRLDSRIMVAQGRRTAGVGFRCAKSAAEPMPQ